MKHNIVYFIAFCTNISLMLYPALDPQARPTRDSRHAQFQNTLAHLRALHATPEEDKDTSNLLPFNLPQAASTQPRLDRNRSELSLASDDHPPLTPTLTSKPRKARTNSLPLRDLSRSSSQDEHHQNAVPLATSHRKFLSCVRRARNSSQATTPIARPRSQSLHDGAARPLRSTPYIPQDAHDTNDDDDAIELPTRPPFREPTHQPRKVDVSTEVNFQETHTLQYVATGSTSAAVSAAATYSIMSWLRPRRRAFTGFEIPAALAIKDAVSGAVSYIALGGVLIFVWRQIHAPCRKAISTTEALVESDKRAVDANYRTALLEFKEEMNRRQRDHERTTVDNLTNIVTETNAAIESHRIETREVTGHIVAALDQVGNLLERPEPGLGQTASTSSQVANILHAAADQATRELATQATHDHEVHVTPPPAPKEPASGCCGGGCSVM